MYEYMTVETNIGTTEEEIGPAAEKGWRLVSTAMHGGTVTLFFERRISLKDVLWITYHKTREYLMHNKYTGQYVRSYSCYNYCKTPQKKYY